MSNTPGIDDSVEVIQVHLEKPSVTFEESYIYSVSIDEREANSDSQRRELYLTQGGEITKEHEDDLFSIYSGENIQQIVISNEAQWIGYYLHLLETSGVPKTEAFSRLNADLKPYFQFQRELTTRKRKLKLLDLADFRVEKGDFIAEKYFESDELTSSHG